MASHSPYTLATQPGQRLHGVAIAYALAFAALLLAILIRQWLDPWLGATYSFVTLFGAVAAAAWLGGYVPAAFVAAAGYLAVNYLFIDPRGQLSRPTGADLAGLMAYGVTCALIIAIGETSRRAQLRERQGRDLLRVTLRSIGDAVITTDVDGRVTYMNSVAETLTGWTLTAAIGHSLADVFHIVNEDTRVAVENPAMTALRDGVAVGMSPHTVLIPRQGDERPIDDSAAPIIDEQGQISGSVLIFRDVSAQRQAERERSAQLHSARLLAAIVESSEDAIVSKGLDGIIRSWNAAAERIFGHAASDVIGRHISVVIPPERLYEEDEIIANLKAGKRIEHFETVRLRADGSRFYVSLTISPVADDAGTIVGASKIVRDITRQRQAEEERQKFVTLVENSRDFIGICDLQGTPSFINRAGLAMVGLDSLDEARRTPVAAFFFPEDQASVTEEFFPSVLRSGHGEIEIRFRHFKTGETIWMAYKVLSLPGVDGAAVAFATVSQDVTERRRLTDNLAKLAAELSEADRKKNEFLAMLAHELRNPLAPISNAVRAFRLGQRDEATLRATSEMLERQVALMSRLVDDLLDISRISRGRITLQRARIDLLPVVQQAIEAAAPQYRRMNHQLTVTLPPGALPLDADGARLSQVIGNLLHNAGKFTDPGGRIALSVEECDGHAVIRVRDNGVGIAAQDRERLFDMFAQADTSLERSRDGLGIGLTLVKSLVEMHLGTVEVHSDGPGTGSEFVVRLPVATDAALTAAAPTEASPAPASVARRVLIVDDSEDGAESLAMLLQFAGHQTFKAHDGLEAIRTAQRLRPDAVLLDIGLPRMNGYEVCARLRKEPWGKNLVIIALTGWGQDEDRRRSKEAGFDAHLVKPVDDEVLIKMLASLTDIRGAAT
jgi:PAS domain S-box-containing protein